jgi:hypothetical protein
VFHAIRDAVPDGWPGEIITAAAVVTAVFFLITRGLIPFYRINRRLYRGIVNLSDRIGDIATHERRLDAVELESSEQRSLLQEIRGDVQEVKAQQQEDHDWTHAALEAFADWTDQFEDFEKINLPPNDKKMTRRQREGEK